MVIYPGFLQRVVRANVVQYLPPQLLLKGPFEGSFTAGACPQELFTFSALEGPLNGGLEFLQRIPSAAAKLTKASSTHLRAKPLGFPVSHFGARSQEYGDLSSFVPLIS